MKQVLKRQGRTIPCQDMDAAINPRMINARSLNELLTVWAAVEVYTGFKWRATSFIRESPNHKTGYALDIAPDIASSSESAYAVFKGSDPVLYKREPLIRALQRLARECQSTSTIGIFIEPDHLHLQLFNVEGSEPEIRIGKWKVPKEVYPDTRERMRLPMTNTAYKC